MSAFDEREKGFEAAFKHDQELQFKIKARRNWLIGLWAAERMGLTGTAADAYAREIVEAEYPDGDRHVVEKLTADLAAKGQTFTAAQVRFELDHIATRAKQQIMRE